MNGMRSLANENRLLTMEDYSPLLFWRLLSDIHPAFHLCENVTREYPSSH